ncbi:DUF262 domain-containing protein [Priestia aryabhattai]|uniref:DUF262 domain-containing protein n=1 Tax=Priestia aryabhattai TaxID=412384 RepID=UPI002E1EB5B0|nr:DUF262 domain-containing protein [Priestia aryabhattai]
MTLKDEIEKKSKEIQTDSYSMSIGELINMYKEKELQVQPDFQRFFRWNDNQKTRLIESILLGIPIPPIFVAQGEGGIWDVIDGLQRLSTILEFVGVLKNENDVLKPPSVLGKTKFLPSLEGKMWNNSEEAENSFTSEQRIDFKRAKLDINIIKRNSDADAKYELFQRLNTGGTALSPQEIRNCLMIMLDKGFYEWVVDLKEDENFTGCLPLTEKQASQQEYMEYVIRFLVYRYCDVSKINVQDDIGEYLTEQMIEIIENGSFDREKEGEVFKETFSYLNSLLADDIFKKFDTNKQKFGGPLLIGSFELLTTGISNNLDNVKTKPKEEIKEIVKGIYDGEAFAQATKPGTKPLNRFKKLFKLGGEVF